jgi:glycosyltransferase involved in cell wall biosynthesis
MNAAARPVLGMVLKGYPRISETFISNEILLLEKLGFSIRIFSMRRGRENFTHRSVARIQAGVDYLPETFLRNAHRLMIHNLCLAIRRPRRYAAGLVLARQRFQRSRNPASLRHFLQAGYLVERCLPGRGVAHLHAHFAHSPASVALYASELSGIPFSFTAHAKDIYTTEPEQLREKIARARFVVTCTEYNRKHLLALAEGLQTPIHCIYHGIDTDLFAGDGEVRWAASPPYQLLSVARLIEKKGIPTVLRAVKHLHENGVRLKYTLIGDGQDREKIRSLVRQLGLDPVCRWLGSQPHHVVLERYRPAMGTETASPTCSSKAWPWGCPW